MGLDDVLPHRLAHRILPPALRVLTNWKVNRICMHAHGMCAYVYVHARACVRMCVNMRMESGECGVCEHAHGVWGVAGSGGEWRGVAGQCSG